MFVAPLPVRGLTGPPTVVRGLTSGARLEGDAVLALGGEAVGALLGLGGGRALVLFRRSVPCGLFHAPMLFPHPPAERQQKYEETT